MSIKVLGIGELSKDEIIRVDRFPLAGEKHSALSSTHTLGGQVLTALAMLSRCGAEVIYAGAVAKDDHDVLCTRLRELAIEPTLFALEDAKTRSALCFVDQEAERTIIERIDPTLILPNDFLDHASLNDRSFDAIHLDATQIDAAIAFLESRDLSQTLISLDLDHYRKNYQPIIERANLLVVSDAIASAFNFDLSQDLLEHLAILAPKAELIVITSGEDGLIALSQRKEIIELSAYPMEDVIDTTGCGDIFRATLIDALLAGKEHHQALRVASAAGALATKGLGAMGYLPTREEIDAFLKRHAY